MSRAVFLEPQVSPAALVENCLGKVVHGSSWGGASLVDGVPVLKLDLGCEVPLVESWQSHGPVRTGEDGAFAWSHDDEMLVGVGAIEATGRWTEPTRIAYTKALVIAREEGYTSLLRMWNYIPSINGRNAHGLEVYRDFCRGRAQAFDAVGEDFGGLPAATGVGARSGGVGFYFLAARRGAVHVENSRQVPAYEYPRRYGPRSPSFARATLHHDDAGLVRLFISGTASIVGHRTVHVGDITRQVEETWRNIVHLLDQPETWRRSGAVWAPHDLEHVKVYVRHEADVPTVEAACRAVVGPDVPLAVFTVDICRSDLLVEIECLTAAARPVDLGP